MNNGGRSNGFSKQYVSVKTIERNLVNKDGVFKSDRKDQDRNDSTNKVNDDTIIRSGSASGSNSKETKNAYVLPFKNRFGALNDKDDGEEIVKWREFCAKIDIMKPLTVSIKEFWAKEMIDYYEGACEDIRSDIINGHFNDVVDESYLEVDLGSLILCTLKSLFSIIREGDHNSAYFHKVLKGRVSKSRIKVVFDDSGNTFYRDEISTKFLEYFENFLGANDHVFPIEDCNDDKVVGPDGFTSKFFKKVWAIVGPDVCCAIREFFTSGKHLGELNANLISLVPKLKVPSKLSDYRPIACCNVVYKCISKVLTNSLKEGLDGLVDINQCSFIPYRHISDNILLTQELMTRIQQYLQNEHYALWEVIEFGDSYKAPPEETGNGSASESSAKKKGRSVVITTEDIDDLDTMSLDDVYNHLKVYEPKVQKKSKSNSQNMAFISSSNTSSGKGEVHTASAPTSSIQVSTASTNILAASLSHDTTGKKIIIQGSDVAGFNKSKVECFNCHKMGHFAREYRTPRSQDRGKKESYKQSPKEEEPASKALMAINGIGWDWSYMVNKEENHALVADDEVPTEFALMAKSSSSSKNEVYGDSYCSKSCRKNTRNLTTKIRKLNEELSDYETDLYHYKRGLSQVEAKLVEFKEHEVKFCEKIRGLERDVEVRNNKIEYLMNELEKVKKEKEGLDNKLTGFESASKDLDNLLGSQRSDKNKEGLGYNVTKEKLLRPQLVGFRDLSKTLLRKVQIAMGNPQNNIDDKGYWDSGCSRHMTGNLSYLSEYEPYDGGYISFKHGGGKITGKGIIKTGKLEFENDYFVKELKYNLFSVSQIYDNKNSVLFNDSECIVLGKDFKLKDDINVLLRTPKQHNMYSIDLYNIVPHKNLTCLVTKASVDESMLWHRRLGHLNVKTINKLIRHNLVKGLPSKCFENDHTCVACLKGKHHKASYKTKLVNSVSKPLHTLHMDLFGPTSISSLNHKWYCLVVTDNFFRCDNGGEFKNKEMNEFCTKKGIRREFNHLGKFDAKGDEGYFVWYSMSSKAFKVFNKRTKKVEENLHVDFLENKLIEKRAGPNWLFDIDTLTNLMNYVPVVVAGTSFTKISSHMETKNSNAPDGYNANVSESSGISNPTATSKVTSADQVEPDVSLIVESKIPTVSSPLLTVYLDNSPKSLSGPRLILKGDCSQKETPSLDDALNLSHKFEDTFGMEADLSNMETSIPVLKNKKDERGIMIRNKARLVAQGYTQEERIDYKEVFAPVARIEAIRLFLAYASFMSFIVYQMDVKSAFLYGTIDEEVYAMQPPGFQDLEFPNRVYKVEKAIYGLHQALELGMLCREFEALMHDKFQMSAMGELTFFLGLQVLKTKDGIFLSQDKYVGDILKKFGYLDVRSANTPMDKENPWGKDGPGKDVELHLYRSMIGSLMYLTASRPDIMFTVCACARHQVTPKEFYLHAVKRIFRYLKGHPKLGLWYPKESPFDLVAYSDSDYYGATQDRKSTTGGCQFLGRRLISWQCKKQTIMATSTTEVEYVAAASGCGQVLWIQNKMLDYGYNFMNTKIYIDNNSAICIVKNHVYHSKTKHIETRHHFIRDCYEKKLINVNHIHRDDNVADLLTKPFDVGRFKHNTDFHQIVDFLEASHIRYALTISPTVYIFDSFGPLLGSKQRIKKQRFSLQFMGKGSAHHTPSPQEQHSPQHDSPPPSHPTTTTEPLPQAPTEHLTLRKYTRRAIRITQSKALFPAADEPASLSRDDRQGETFPTVSSLDARQDRENIAKTYALPHDSSPRVTSLDADEGNMQQRIYELMELCTCLQRQQSQMAAKIKDQDQEISELKARVNLTEATNILTSGGAAAATSVSLADVLPVAGVPTVSGSFPTVSVIFTTASVVTPYSRRPRRITIGTSQPMKSPIIREKDKGKEKVVESEVPKKRKLQEQIDAQVAREMEEEFAIENQRVSEQLARDFEIARLHAKKELKIMIEGLDISNEVIAKHLREYEQAKVDLSVGEKLELMSELVKYQDHRAKILKYQAQHSKPVSKKEQMEFYMAVLRSHAGWKTKHFKGMTLEQIKEKFIPVWKQLEYFVPMSLKEEAERVKRQGLKIDQGSSKRMKTSKDVSEEDLKGMMQLVPLEEVYVEALKLWTLVKETFSIKLATKDKEKELWVELKRLFELDFKDQLWTRNQAFMHDPLDWKLYDTCGIHHVSTKDQRIFMLVEKDYPLKKGLATMMISSRLQVEQYS
nr:putative ribonuclease H-like domain-containing protein [Tanacetum cinerariifolium]